MQLHATTLSLVTLRHNTWDSSCHVWWTFVVVYEFFPHQADPCTQGPQYETFVAASKYFPKWPLPRVSDATEPDAL